MRLRHGKNLRILKNLPTYNENRPGTPTLALINKNILSATYELFTIQRKKVSLNMSSYESIRDTALDKLKNYIDDLDPDKGKKLAYWVSDYVNFLDSEATFTPDKLIRYKRGSIIKVHLGYRIGSEEGGLHYAIVMDRQNSIHSPTITVIPLTSIKSGVDFMEVTPA